MREQPLRVLHIITALQAGGAESMLLNVMTRSDAQRFQMEAIALLPLGPIGLKMQRLGCSVSDLGMQQGLPDPRYLFRLRSIVKKTNPDVIQTWMYHADLIGGLACLGLPAPVVWNVRHGNLSPKLNKRTTLWTVGACARLSHRIPRSIVCCSQAAMHTHVSAGYEAGKMQVIPNGFDLSSFTPDGEVRRYQRSCLQIGDNAVVIGLAARFDPQKDHSSFLKAAFEVAALRKDAYFVLCGAGVEWSNAELAQAIRATPYSDRFRLIGHRTDMPAVYNIFDVLASSSLGEAFPNSLGEAMATGLPCVATDVGDSALLLGECGEIVAPGKPDELAKALCRTIDLGSDGRKRRGEAARLRVHLHFNLQNVIEQYSSLYEGVGSRTVQ